MLGHMLHIFTLEVYLSSSYISVVYECDVDMVGGKTLSALFVSINESISFPLGKTGLDVCNFVL